MKVLFTFTLALFSIFSFAQEIENKPTVQDFFKMYAKSPKNAFDKMYDLKAFGSDATSREEGLVSFIIEFNKVSNDLGIYYDYELSERKQISSSLIINKYMLKYEEAALFFEFTLYMPYDHWHLVKFNWYKYNL